MGGQRTLDRVTKEGGRETHCIADVRRADERAALASWRARGAVKACMVCAWVCVSEEKEKRRVGEESESGGRLRCAWRSLAMRVIVQTGAGANRRPATTVQTPRVFVSSSLLRSRIAESAGREGNVPTTQA